MKLVFFNQVLIVGFFALSLQLFAAWPFIGLKSLYFLLVSLAAFIALFLNHYGYTWWSKRFFILVVYSVGLWSTTEIGGDGLYHIGVLSTFAFSLIIFDTKKEIIELFIGFVFVILVIMVGEMDLFNPPNFSDHPQIQSLRFISLINIFAVNSILTIFVLRLNNINELKLEKSKSNLEKQVKERTLVLSRQKQALTEQNLEKEILLKEVHHRVNNNLQVIVSLINLQVSKSGNEAINDALNEIQSRVLSMALVHKKMYQTSNFTNIGFKDYLIQMIDNISELYEGEGASFELDIDSSISFKLEKAIPLGLIFNEIITNFYKHAFEKLDVPISFKVVLTKEEGDVLVVRYSDNGPGFPGFEVSDDVTSLGLQLIQSLSEQINGEIKFYSEGGAVYELIIRK